MVDLVYVQMVKPLAQTDSVFHGTSFVMVIMIVQTDLMKLTAVSVEGLQLYKYYIGNCIGEV